MAVQISIALLDRHTGSIAHHQLEALLQELLENGAKDKKGCQVNESLKFLNFLRNDLAVVAGGGWRWLSGG